MRPVTCSRFQESHALSENPVTTQNAVIRMTAWSSADTVRRFSMVSPPTTFPLIRAKNRKDFRRYASRTTTDPLQGEPAGFPLREPQPPSRVDVKYWPMCEGIFHADRRTRDVSGRHSGSLPDQPAAAGWP